MILRVPTASLPAKYLARYQAHGILVVQLVAEPFAIAPYLFEIKILEHPSIGGDDSDLSALAQLACERLSFRDISLVEPLSEILDLS